MLCCFGPNLRLHCPLSLHINPCLVTVSAIYWARGSSMAASDWTTASHTGLWLAAEDWAPHTMQFRVPLHWTFGARPLCCKVRRNQSMPSWSWKPFSTEIYSYPQDTCCKYFEVEKCCFVQVNVLTSSFYPRLHFLSLNLWPESKSAHLTTLTMYVVMS